MSQYPNSQQSNYPLTNILNPGENDILCGRGGGTNAHSGNIKFRKLVAAHKLRYLAASKSDKPNVARDVVKEWRGMNPPGRFLAKMDVKMMISLNLITVEEIKEEAAQDAAAASSGVDGNGVTKKKKEKVYWYDVGDKKAREKASQCLRERNGAANEAVAALVKTVTANGEACPEDYATLMSKAAQLKEQQGGGGPQDGGNGGFGMGGGMQQQQHQQMNMYNTSMGGYGGGGNTNNMGGAYNNMGGGYPIDPVISGGGNMNNNSGMGNSTEDDMIEAEIQRLLREKQEQKMMMGGGNNNNNNNNMGGRGGGGGGGGPSHNLNSHNNNFGYGGDIQPYMGEESVLREYQALIQKQQELDARLANAKVMMSQQQHQGNNNNGGGGGMMSSPYNTNNMGGMMGGRGGNHYGNQQQQQFMQDAPQSMSPNNPNPNAARDYMNRLRMMRQGNNIDIPFQYNNNGMPENVQSSSGGMANMGNMNNMGGGGGGGGNMNNMGGNNGMNNMGGGNMGGVNSQKEFNLEDYQASLQEFLGHDDGNKNNGSGGQVRRQHSMASQATQNFNNTSNAAYAAAGGGGSAEVLKVPTNLHDGNRRSAARRNSDRSIDDIDLPIGRNTFKSVDSDDRPSFQSIDDVGIGGIRDTFRSVDTMDLMSIGASLNEIVEEDIKQNESEQRKKNSRRLSATSIHSRYARGALGGGGATLSDYAQLPGPTVDVKTMSHGQGGGGGPKKIKKAIDPRLVALAGRESAARGTKSSMLSQDLNLEGIDDAERMSFGGLSIMSGLTDFGDDIDVANVKGLGGNIEE
eukprot:scaffold6619_cov146-Skeletonema_menzelii.AAC.9